MKELTRLNISRIASITRNFLGIAVENTELGHLIMTLADTQRETQG